MKKSMVITTVLMVLLLIVALSTATFAWYTAQATATVNKTTVTSANSSSASLVIDEIAAQSNTATQSFVDITMAAGTEGVKPAILKASAAPVAGTTTLDDFTFMTYTVNSANTKYASVPVGTDPAEIKTVQGTSSNAQTQDSFFVTNVGGQSTKITATVTIDPEYYAEKDVETGESVANLYTKNADGAYEAATGNAVAGTKYYEKKSNAFLKVAMFVKGTITVPGEEGEEGEEVEAFIYVGTWAATDLQKAVQYYAFTEETINEGDALPTHNTSYNATVSGSSATVQESVASMEAVEITLIAWFEGDLQTNAYAGSYSAFSVSFKAE